MTVEAPTMSPQTAKPTEGPCRERHVLSVVMENKPLSHDVVDGGYYVSTRRQVGSA